MNIVKASNKRHVAKADTLQKTTPDITISKENIETKKKLEKIRDIISERQENDILIALLENNMNVEATIQELLDDNCSKNSKYGEWQHETRKRKGKKSKQTEVEAEQEKQEESEITVETVPSQAKPNKSTRKIRGGSRNKLKDTNDKLEKENSEKSHSDFGKRSRSGRGRIGVSSRTRGGFNRGNLNRNSNSSRSDRKPKQEFGLWENGMDTKQSWDEEVDEWQGTLSDTKVFTRTNLESAPQHSQIKTTHDSGDDFGGQFTPSIVEKTLPTSNTNTFNTETFNKEATESLKSVIGIGSSSVKGISFSKRVDPGTQQSSKVISEIPVEMPSGNIDAYNVNVSFGWGDSSEALSSSTNVNNFQFGDVNGTISQTIKQHESRNKQSPMANQTLFSSPQKSDSSQAAIIQSNYSTSGTNLPNKSYNAPTYVSDTQSLYNTATVKSYSSTTTQSNTMNYSYSTTNTTSSSVDNTSMAKAASKLNETMNKMAIDDNLSHITSTQSSNRISGSRTTSNGYVSGIGNKMPANLGMPTQLMNPAMLYGQGNSSNPNTLSYYSNMHSNHGQVYNPSYENEVMMQRMAMPMYDIPQFQQPRNDSSSQPYVPGSNVTDKLNRIDSQSTAITSTSPVVSSSGQVHYINNTAIPPGYQQYYTATPHGNYVAQGQHMYYTANSYNTQPPKYPYNQSTTTVSGSGGIPSSASVSNSAGISGSADIYGTGSLPKSAYDKGYSTTTPYLPQSHYQPHLYNNMQHGAMMNMMPINTHQDRVNLNSSSKGTGGSTNGKYYNNSGNSWN